MRAEGFDDTALSEDHILGGRVVLRQPKDGYRAGVDPVLLAASIPAKPGQSVLELGCGAGPGLCCLGTRVADLSLFGLEVQPAYAALARDNLGHNGLEATVWTGDLRQPPPDMKARTFYHVFANPPYFETGKREGASDPGRETALAGDTPLTDWVAQAARRVRPKGSVTFIQRVERLPELLTAFSQVLGGLELMPLVPRVGRAPRLILLRGRKDAKAPFQMHPAMVLHQGDSHLADKEDYSARVLAILRDGAALTFP